MPSLSASSPSARHAAHLPLPAAAAAPLAPLASHTSLTFLAFTPRGVIVTGGHGFIGAAAVNDFVLARGWRVLNVDRGTYAADPARIAAATRASPLYSEQALDICETEALAAAIRGAGADTVVHFAAQTHVDRSFDDPEAFVRDNVLGTLSVMRAALAAGVARVVHVSTDEVYGETPDAPADEDAPLRPTNPYAASKAAAEMFATAYARCFACPVIITRANNVFGPGQHEEKVIPRFVAQLRRGAPFTLAGGTGATRRGFLHAHDAAAAFAAVVTRGRCGAVYNLESDPESEVSIRELADLLVAVSGRPHPGFTGMADRPFNDSVYRVDGSRIRRETGWAPRVSLVDGLRQIWAAANEAVQEDSEAAEEDSEAAEENSEAAEENSEAAEENSEAVEENSEAAEEDSEAAEENSEAVEENSEAAEEDSEGEGMPALGRIPDIRDDDSEEDGDGDASEGEDGEGELRDGKAGEAGATKNESSKGNDEEGGGDAQDLARSGTWMRRSRAVRSFLDLC